MALPLCDRQEEVLARLRELRPGFDVDECWHDPARWQREVNGKTRLTAVCRGCETNVSAALAMLLRGQNFSLCPCRASPGQLKAFRNRIITLQHRALARKGAKVKRLVNAKRPVKARRFARTQESTKEDALYVFQNSQIPGEYKVGRSRNSESRAAELERSQNFRIVELVMLPAMGFLEASVHERLARYRVQGSPGREWFHCPFQIILTSIGQVMEERALDC